MKMILDKEPGQEQPKPEQTSIFKKLKGVERNSFITDLVTGGFLFIYFIISIPLYIESKRIPNSYLVNHIFCAIGVKLVLIDMIFSIINFVKNKKKYYEDKRIKNAIIIGMSLTIFAFVLMVVSIFVLKYFQLAVFAMISFLIMLDVCISKTKIAEIAKK